MDSDKKFYGIVFSLVLLLGISVFFLFTFLGDSDTSTPPATTPETPVDVPVSGDVTALSVSIANRGNPVQNSDGSFTVNYRVTIQNVSQYRVRNVTARNNLAARFAPHTIQMVEKTATDLTVNGRFNGVSNIDMLFGNDVLEAGQSGYIDVTFNLIPTTPIESLAAFVNGVVVDGDIVYPDAGGDDDDDNDGGDGGDGSGNNDGGNNGGTTPDDGFIPEDNLTPREFTFELINVDTGEVIRTISPGENIDLADLDTDNVTVRGVPGVGTRGSVVFDYNGQTNYLTENTAPFSISGNPTATTYGPWNYALGEQDIRIRAFTGRRGQGEQIGDSSISFSFSDSRTAPVGGENFGEGDPDTSESAVVDVNIPGSGTTPDDDDDETVIPGGNSQAGGEDDEDPIVGGNNNPVPNNNNNNNNNTNNGSKPVPNAGGQTPNPTLPATGILDDNIVVLMSGLSLIVAGIVVYRTRYFTSILNKLLLTHVSDAPEAEDNRLEF